MNTFYLENLIKEPTCYKLNNPICEELIFTNQKRFTNQEALLKWFVWKKIYQRVTLKKYSIETTNYLIKAILKMISKHN